MFCNKTRLTNKHQLILEILAVGTLEEEYRWRDPANGKTLKRTRDIQVVTLKDAHNIANTFIECGFDGLRELFKNVGDIDAGKKAFIKKNGTYKKTLVFSRVRELRCKVTKAIYSFLIRKKFKEYVYENYNKTLERNFTILNKEDGFNYMYSYNAYLHVFSFVDGLVNNVNDKIHFKYMLEHGALGGEFLSIRNDFGSFAARVVTKITKKVILSFFNESEINVLNV